MSCKLSGSHAEQTELRGLIQDRLVPVAMLVLQPTSQLLYSGSFFPFRCSSGYVGEYCEMGLSQGVPPGTSKF